MPASDLTGILPLLVGLVLFGLSFFVFRAGRNHSYNHAFAALYFTSAVKSIAEGILPFSPRLHDASASFPGPAAWLQLGTLAAVLLPPLLLLFVADFPLPLPLFRQAPFLRWFLFLPSLVFASFSFFPAVVDAEFLGRAFNVFALIAIAGAVLILRRARANLKDKVERSRTGYVLAAFTIYLGLSLVVGLLQLTASPSQLFVLEWVTPIVELVVAATTGYAIVKYQVLGIELKVKAGLKYTVVSGVTVVVFFVANNTFQKVVEPLFAFTQLSFLLAALLATIVFIPIQKATGALMNRLFPATVEAPKAYLTKRGHDIYQSQLNYILRDGDVTDKERRFLDNLRGELDLTFKDARAIEGDVRKALGIPAAKARKG